MSDVRLLFIPGVSLMEVTPEQDGVRVRCPGCGAEAVLCGTGERNFEHGPGCPVYRRIADLLARAAREPLKRG